MTLNRFSLKKKVASLMLFREEVPTRPELHETPDQQQCGYPRMWPSKPFNSEEIWRPWPCGIIAEIWNLASILGTLIRILPRQLVEFEFNLKSNLELRISWWPWNLCRLSSESIWPSWDRNLPFSPGLVYIWLQTHSNVVDSQLPAGN